MPNLRKYASRLPPRRCVTSSPSTLIVPASAWIMPSTHLMVTDLPLPEPPMMTSESPGWMDRSTPSSTIFGPKRFFTPLSSILGTPVIAASMGEEDGGEDVIGSEDQDGCRHHRIGG